MVGVVGGPGVPHPLHLHLPLGLLAKARRVVVLVRVGRKAVGKANKRLWRCWRGVRDPVVYLNRCGILPPALALVVVKLQV